MSNWVDELDRKVQAATPGEWVFNEVGGTDSASWELVLNDYETGAAFLIGRDFGMEDATAIVALYNAWPRIREELTQLRELRETRELEPEWTQIADDPATWPEDGQLVVVWGGDCEPEGQMWLQYFEKADCLSTEPYWYGWKGAWWRPLTAADRPPEDE